MVNQIYGLFGNPMRLLILTVLCLESFVFGQSDSNSSGYADSSPFSLNTSTDQGADDSGYADSNP
ncbi:hypothetical protein N9H22_02560, partial [Opitutales bacterium]|nr:hypothetical protein [Opitutales bacterium]